MNATRPARPLFFVVAALALAGGLGIFDEAAALPGQWFPRAALSIARQDAAGGALTSFAGQFHVAGGASGSAALLRSLESYTPGGNWAPAPQLMPTARRGIGAAAFQGKLFVIGGFTVSEPSGLNTVEAWNPQSGGWSAVGSTLMHRVYPSVVVANGELYAVGGLVNGTATGSVEKYDSIHGTWNIQPGLLMARAGAGVASIGGIIYVIGGQDATGNRTATVEAYDPLSFISTPRAPLANPRWRMGVMVIDGKIYVAGGADFTPVPAAEVYDPVTDAWAPVEALPVPLRGCVAGAVGSAGFVAGGFDGVSVRGETYEFVEEPPVFDLLPGQTIGEGQHLSFVVHAADPESDPLSYVALSLPSDAVFDPGSATFDWTPGPGTAGPHQASFTASDGLLRDTLTVSISVLPPSNQPPVVQPVPDQWTAEDQLLTVTPFAFDPDGDHLTWSGAGLPAGAAVDPLTGRLTWTACLDQEGVYAGVTLIATDPLGASGSASFTITVAQADTTMYGSCVFSDGTCFTLTPGQCFAEGGDYQGDGTRCSPDGLAQDTTVEKWTVIPVKINVLGNESFSKDDAEEMIKAANEIMKQAKIKFELDKDKGVSNGASDGGNGDSKIDANEENGLFKSGEDELKKKKDDGGFDGKGFKIFITSGFGANPARQGFSRHKKPVAMVRNFSAKGMGEVLAHEVAHALTLAKKAKYNDAGDQSDDNGHVDDPENLMYEEPGHSHNGPKLEGPQIAEINKPENAGARGETKEERAQQGPQRPGLFGPYVLVPLNVRSTIWTDSLTDGSRPGLELASGQLMVDDPAVNLSIRIGLSGLLPGVTDTLSYQVAFDTDNRSDTGIVWGSYAGIDKVLDVRATGQAPYSWSRDNLHARLLDTATGRWGCVPAGGVTREFAISDADSTGTPGREAYGDMITQPVGFTSMGFTADSVRFGIRALELDSGGVVALDESPGGLLYLGPRLGPSVTMDPLVLPAGASTTLSGAGFGAFSPIHILLDDSLQVVTFADGAGSFTSPLLVPQIPEGYYFVTARDTTGAFDFSVLAVAPATVHVGPPSGAPGAITVERNPFRASVTLRLPGEGRGSIEIFDVAGRLVRRLRVTADGPDADRVIWNGKDGAGVEAPGGIYFVRLTRGQLTAGARVVKLP